MKARSMHLSINGIKTRYTFINFVRTIVVQARCSINIKEFGKFWYGCDHQRRALFIAFSKPFFVM